mmetsp:Transcript_22112/g.73175  ORF Transcript_22112/g.73175 Transcript_22112/m.73175 type:complete len:312 (+) Transcript_22112:149-1084(+)
MRRSRSARSPASVQTALMSAPLSSSLAMTKASRSTSSPRDMRPVWMPKMWRFVLMSGSGNSILRSMRPGRSSALSRMSMRFVAMMTLMDCVGSKPSSWLRSSSIVRPTSESPPSPPSPRLDPMESTSSMKMMDGAASRAMTKSSRTMRDPSPMYFCTSSAPETRTNVQSVWCATARARSVLPVPGGPSRSTPRGVFAPTLVNFSGYLRKSTTSTSSSLDESQPATSSKVTPVLGSISILFWFWSMPMGPPGPPPPMPPMPPPAAAASAGSGGRSATRASAVIMSAATDCASVIAVLTTFAGSTMPASYMST